jgi:recombination protein RecT
LDENTKNAKAIALRKAVVEDIENRIELLRAEGSLNFPPNYSPHNALQSAWLILQETVDRNKRPVLEVCSRSSVTNALLDTVIQGLSPVKKQAYYIAYGDKLSMFRSYHGTKAVAKRLNGVLDVNAQIIHEGDEFVYEINDGVIKVVSHKQTLENIDAPIRAAYCVITFSDGRPPYTEVMSKKQIDAAWSKTKTGGGTQKEFPEEMAMRSVINRACKRFVNTSDDSDLVIEAFNRSEGETDAPEEAERQIAANANKGVVDASSAFSATTQKPANPSAKRSNIAPIDADYTPVPESADDENEPLPWHEAEDRGF